MVARAGYSNSNLLMQTKRKKHFDFSLEMTKLLHQWLKDCNFQSADIPPFLLLCLSAEMIKSIYADLVFTAYAARAVCN